MGRKVVFMDIDGTLMLRGKVSERVINAIQAARAEGHLFFLCTGRSRGNMPDWMLEAEYLDGYVLGCGMHCEIHGDVIFHDRLSDEVVIEVAKYFFGNGRECLYEGEKQILSVNSKREEVMNFENMDQLVASREDQPVTKLTVPGQYRPEDGEFLSKWFDVYDMDGYSDVVLSGNSKATGMQHVLDYLGMSRENCIGVGDSKNDLPMIEFAGLGVAMGNAPEEVRLAADAVTETCENDGVAVMIERYVLGK